MHGARILQYKNVIITIFLITCNYEGKIKVVVVVVVVSGVAQRYGYI